MRSSRPSRRTCKTANDKFALGPDLYAQMVAQTERVDLPVDQIEAAGRADLDRNTAALKAECATYAPKESVQQCVAKMSAQQAQGRPWRRRASSW